MLKTWLHERSVNEGRILGLHLSQMRVLKPRQLKACADPRLRHITPTLPGGLGRLPPLSDQGSAPGTARTYSSAGWRHRWQADVMLRPFRTKSWPRGKLRTQWAPSPNGLARKALSL